MSYVAHPATKLASRAYFADFKLGLAWSGPGKVVHLFTCIGAFIPFYLFSSAYRAAKDSRTKPHRGRFRFALLFRQIWLCSNLSCVICCTPLRAKIVCIENTQLLPSLSLVRTPKPLVFRGEFFIA